MIFQHQTMSIKSSILIILLTTLIATQSASAQSGIPTEPTFFLQFCDPSFGNYTATSTYASNLKTALSALQEQSSTYLFYNASAGEAHAQYYCRGDIDSALCSACISQASETVVTSCSNFKSAYIWYDVCSLRYHNESMLGVLATNWVAYGWSTANVSDPDTFSVILNSTLETLIKAAAYGSDLRRFAVGDVAVSTFETTYFLVQCSPDLSAVECDTCLWDTYEYINRCCGNWPVRARVFFPSCQMRYSDLLFYSAPSSPPPPPTPQLSSPPPPPSDFLAPPPPQLSTPPPPPSDFLAPPPPPAVTTFSPTDGTINASSERVKVGLAVICLAFLTLHL